MTRLAIFLDHPATLDHTFFMFASLFGRCIGIFSAVAVLLLFFFPLVTGPFPATHGPATVFRLKWAVLMLLLSMVIAAFRVSSMRLVKVPLASARLAKAKESMAYGVMPAAVLGVLRC
jgi:hypothetical protein